MKCWENVKAQEIRSFLNKVYNSSGHKEDIKSLSDGEVFELADNLKTEFITNVFDGATENEIKNMLTIADLPLLDKFS